MRRTHAEAVGVIAATHPWSEDVWGWGSVYLVHWQQGCVAPTCSLATDRRHTWRLHIPRLALEFSIRYGTVVHG